MENLNHNKTKKFFLVDRDFPLEILPKSFANSEKIISFDYESHQYLLEKRCSHISSNDFLNLSNEYFNQFDKKQKCYQHVTQFFFNYKNNIYKQKLYDYLRPDYEFINSITFHEPR